MMVDRANCDTLLGLLTGSVGELRRLAAIPAAELLADPDKVASAKYHFVVAIECCLDVASHVIAAERFRSPSDSADAFTVLVRDDHRGPGGLRRGLGLVSLLIPPVTFMPEPLLLP